MTLSRESLLAAGWQEHPLSRLDQHDETYLYQVNDRRGRRYTVVCRFWRHSKYGAIPDGWEVVLTYNDANPGFGGGVPFAAEVRAWAGVEKWTPDECLRWGDFVWHAMKPAYYRVNDEDD